MLIIGLLLGLGCNPNTQKQERVMASVLPQQAEDLLQEAIEERIGTPIEKPYEIKLKMIPEKKDTYILQVRMLLKDGAYYVSPNSRRDFKGTFGIHMNDKQKLKPIDALIETPISVEEFDTHPFVNGYVNWVRENTTYTQRLQRTTNANFKISGLIRFTIEPNCTLEQIPFIISYDQGEMKIEIDQC